MHSFPAHTPAGLLPPFEGGDPAVARVGRSPYTTNWGDLISRFGTSARRQEILRGLLAYRAGLRALGITDGFQWLNGSFVELMTREPNDVDLVTFFVKPATLTSAVAKQHLELFDPRQAKVKFHCDAYSVTLPVTPMQLIDGTVYWYGLFSHQRATFAWKGFLQLPLLSEADDNDAHALLGGAP